MKLEDFTKFGEQKMYVKVIKVSEDRPTPAKNLLGKVCEVIWIDFTTKSVSVRNDYKSIYWNYPFDDIQQMTPLFHKGVQIGIGDTVVTRSGMTGTVIQYRWCDGGYAVNIAKNGDIKDIYRSYEENIDSHTPLYPSTETIELMGKKYDKHALEERLQGLKEINE